MNQRPHTLAQAQAELNGSFIPEPMEKTALQVLSDAMKATAYVRGPRGPGGQIEYIEVPDHAIRVVAATKVLEWRRGKPSQPIELPPPPPDGGNKPKDLAAIVAKNPDLARQIIESHIASAKKAEVTDVIATSAGSSQSAPESKSGGSPS